MDLQLKERTALVTGSTQGIGLAIARELLEEGAAVILNGRTEARVSAAVDKLRREVPGAVVSGIAADFSRAQEVDRLLQKADAVDILVNNAGIFEPKPFGDITDGE